MAFSPLRYDALIQGKVAVAQIEAQAHPSQGASETPPSAFPQKLENTGRVRQFNPDRGLARYEEKVAESLVPRNRIPSVLIEGSVDYSREKKTEGGWLVHTRRCCMHSCLLVYRRI